MLGGAPPKRGRWAKRPPRRTEPGEHRREILFLFALTFFIVGGVLGFGWEMDRQLRGGILEQRVEAEARRDWISLAELPPVLPRMVVAVVDPGFQGRRPLGSGEDGPTLTRELVRQVHRLDGGLREEAREMLMSPLLEARLSKRDILELYLNRVYFGRSDGWPVYGVSHAAREFFGKEPEELTLGESATLAGLLLEPRIHNPEGAPGAVGARRNEVLRRMMEAGVIGPSAYRAATSEPLAFQPGVEFAPMTRPLPREGEEEDEEEVMRLPAPGSPEASPAEPPRGA